MHNATTIVTNPVGNGKKKKFTIAQLQPTDKITILRNILGAAQQNDMKKMAEEEKLQTLPNFQLLTSFLSNL